MLSLKKDIDFTDKKDSFSIKAFFSEDDKKIEEVIRESFKKYLKYIDYK